MQRGFEGVRAQACRRGELGLLAELDASGDLYLPARRLSGAEVTEDPSLVRAKLRGDIVRVPSARVGAWRTPTKRPGLLSRTRSRLCAALGRPAEGLQAPHPCSNALPHGRRRIIQVHDEPQDGLAAGHVGGDHPAPSAGFVRQGMSNRDVAGQLFVSSRTVDFHLRNVFSKLVVTSRAKLIAMDLPEQRTSG
jgi:hypothetical protein